MRPKQVAKQILSDIEDSLAVRGDSTYKIRESYYHITGAIVTDPEYGDVFQIIYINLAVDLQNKGIFTLLVKLIEREYDMYVMVRCVMNDHLLESLSNNRKWKRINELDDFIKIN